MAIKDAIIAIDFDGTVVTHAYPKIGIDTGAVPVIKELVDNGYRIILHTMRSGILLDEAVKWYKDRDIPLFAVNKNPEQSEWTASPKVHANLYIDDSNLGVPLRFIDHIKHPVVDWALVREALVDRGYLD